MLYNNTFKFVRFAQFNDTDVKVSGTLHTVDASGVLVHADEVEDKEFKEAANKVDAPSDQSSINKFLLGQIKIAKDAADAASGDTSKISELLEGYVTDEELENALAGLAGGLTYKGAATAINGQAFQQSLQLALGGTSAKQGDVVRILAPGTLGSTVLEKGDILIFNSDVEDVRNDGLFSHIDVVQGNIDAANLVQKASGDTAPVAGNLVTIDSDGNIAKYNTPSVTAGEYGSSTSIPKVTIDSNGIVTAIESVDVTIPDTVTGLASTWEEHDSDDRVSGAIGAATIKIGDTEGATITPGANTIIKKNGTSITIDTYGVVKETELESKIDNLGYAKTDDTKITVTQDGDVVDVQQSNSSVFGIKAGDGITVQYKEDAKQVVISSNGTSDSPIAVEAKDAKEGELSVESICV